MKIVCTVILILSLFACKSQPRNNLSTIQIIENYNGNINSSVRDNISTVPEIIINSLNKMDNVNTYTSYKLNDSESELLWYYLSRYYNINYKSILMKNKEPIMFYDPNHNELIKQRYKFFEEIIK